MSKAKIGVQMMVLKDKVAELGIYELMRQVSEMGYPSVEISQIPMTEENVDQLRKASLDFGVDISSCSATIDPMFPGMPGDTLTSDFDKIVADCKKLDCKYLRLGMIPFSMIGNRESFIEFAKKAEDMGARLREQGIHLYYHNHHVEFQKLDGEWGLDLIRNNSTNLGFELDVHWIQRAGLDPIKVIKAYKGRVNIIHLKDYRIGNLDLSALKTGDMKKFFADFQNIIEFAELGQGNLDLKGIIEAGLESGVEYFFVEQDDTYGRDPMESLKISKDHLVHLGYGDLLKA